VEGEAAGEGEGRVSEARERLAEEWREFQSDVIRFGGNERLLCALERAFFAGCQTVLMIVDNDVFDHVKSTAESWEVLEALRAEMARYIERCRGTVQ
jgi:hypothetical protein